MSMWYGSLNNRISERCKQPEPVVGMGVTECLYSDRNPFEIIEVKDPKNIVVRAMSYKRTDNNGMSESQEYTYFSNPDGQVFHLTLRNGRWRDREWKVEYVMGPDGKPEYDADGNLKVKSMKPGRKLGPNGWSLGKAERYYDFSF